MNTNSILYPNQILYSKSDKTLENGRCIEYKNKYKVLTFRPFVSGGRNTKIVLRCVNNNRLISLYHRELQYFNDKVSRAREIISDYKNR